MAVQSPPSTAIYCYGVTWAESAHSQRGGLGGKSVELLLHGFHNCVATLQYRDGGVVLDSIDANKLRDALKPYVGGEDRKREIILDARDITWENTIQIQDGARAAGVQTVHHLLRK